MNLQGDVVKLVWYIPGFEYEAVATYTYDAWGNILTATGDMAEINPLRYRGYYYDTETGLYYLQSRYYDPATRRFINADGYASTGQGFIGHNMFAYCNNCPLTYSDPTGMLAYPGEIHNAVVRHLTIFLPFMSSEQRILYDVGWGRADLISADGQVWEVKRDKTWQINRGLKQLERYVNGTWAANPSQALRVGDEIPGGHFDYTSGLITYHVEYRYAGNGVIAYDYWIKDTNIEAVAAAAAAVVIVHVAATFLGSLRLNQSKVAASNF